jgi:hypothetical protein
MAITALDTHQTVKDLTAAGFTDAQAEALAYALRQAQQIDLSKLATKSDLAELRTTTKSDLAELRTTIRADMAELKADLLKWFIGVAFAEIALILTIFRLFPGGHP